ncbi:hypothetical protein A7K93_11295 [Candidatus Methylacidiphilum fumarolicum]|nr:hypothetical protein [Candidatus Methylacidiphilum fumarolicum]MBW6415366.1 hypothetical protein [Candidatus Methylacidiphilum fumarolicum]TFE66057.1 hypothetical protein A7K73_10790 [Candidatus Methylacidiphilum fumarolicum]TFE71177.1 hypothetical protein A7K93_11295 [Candidatus Methylacidiphilum fumarolicum]TFE71446.1 hypothetical protein A7K72_10970 [Candidatus Methylacidiphilum fumarolicum]TFE77811.1 hypothetical protein A7D33_02885 [Candidatus Methylacidiphilum fumarolicum]
MKRKINLSFLLAAIFVVIFGGESARADIMLTTKGYRLTILPIMGAEKVVVPEGKVKVRELAEMSFDKKKSFSNTQKDFTNNRMGKKCPYIVLKNKGIDQVTQLTLR